MPLITPATIVSVAIHIETAAIHILGRERMSAIDRRDVTWRLKKAKQSEDLCDRFSHFPDLNLSEFGLIPICFMMHLKLHKQ